MEEQSPGNSWKVVEPHGRSQKLVEGTKQRVNKGRKKEIEGERSVSAQFLWSLLILIFFSSYPFAFPRQFSHTRSLLGIHEDMTFMTITTI